MTITLAPDEDAALTALRSFILAVLPGGTECIVGQVNRVPEPAALDFVVMTPILAQRQATNVITYADCRCVGSIAGTVMTITQVDFGTISVGSVIFGVDVDDSTVVTGTLGGTGGVGDYSVSPAQVVSGTLSAGVMNADKSTRVVIQLDVHGPTSYSNAQRLSTLIRDDYCALFFQRAGYLAISPIDADEPRQIPFINAESQYETRWIVDASLDVEFRVADIPQEFADTVEVTTVLADVLP